MSAAQATHTRRLRALAAAMRADLFNSYDADSSAVLNIDAGQKAKRYLYLQGARRVPHDGRGCVAGVGTERVGRLV